MTRKTRIRKAIIVGRSREALDDYEAALSLCRYDYTLVVGKMAVDFPGEIDHWVSFHGNLFARWGAERHRRGFPPPGLCWAGIYKGRRLGAHLPFPAPRRYIRAIGGSSGYMAIQVAIDQLKAEKTVLAGIPMQAAAGHFGTDEDVWREADTYWRTWEANLDKLMGRVKSMSGRTREVLGEPTKEWLSELCNAKGGP